MRLYLVRIRKIAWATSSIPNKKGGAFVNLFTFVAAADQIVPHPCPRLSKLILLCSTHGR
eukprot:scaffold2177_cov373-Prasinococcus_capsulatus_cf.AAC.2